MAAGEDVLDNLFRVGRGNDFFQTAFRADKACRDIRIDMTAAGKQQNLALACVLFLDHGDLPVWLGLCSKFVLLSTEGILSLYSDNFWKYIV